MIDLSKIVKEMKKDGFEGTVVGSEYKSTALVPFRNKAMNLITEGGLPYGHIHEFFGLSATGKCVGGETLISTNEGLLPIEDLFSPLVDTSSKFSVRTIPVHTVLEAERWYRLKKPIKVKSPNGEYEDVTRLYYGGKEPVYVLYTRNNHHITGTPEHKIQVVTAKSYYRKYLSLDELRKADQGEYLVPMICGAGIYGTSTRILSNEGKFPTELTPEIAYDLGRISMCISLTNFFGPKILKYRKPIIDAIQRDWTDKGVGFGDKDSTFVKWLILNEIVISSMETTEVPFIIKQAPREIVIAYILGVLSLATLIKKDKLELRHKSYHLITQLQTLLLNEGIMSAVSFDSRHSMKVLHVSAYDIDALGSGKWVATPQVIYEPIRRIWKSRTSMPVYDLEMADTHAYVANNFYSHNSYFMYELLAQAQKENESTIGVLVDREGAYTTVRGEQIGIDNNRLIFTRPSDTPLPNNAVDFIEKSVKGIRTQDKTAHIIIILDSMGAFDKDVKRDKQDMGKGAMGWHNAFRDILNIIDERTMMIFSNHVTFNPTAFGNNRTKPGGEAANYYRSCGVALENRVKLIDPTKGNEVVGNRIQVIVDKTRQGPAFRQVILPYYYDKGVTEYAGYLWLLVSRGYIKPKNKDDFKKGKGKTFLYTVDGTTYTLFEGTEEAILTKFPELNFTSYPEYNPNAVKDDSEEGDEE